MPQSRSSRLFIVLLHLVGVSTNLPRNIWGSNSGQGGQGGRGNRPYWQGIVGVHPMAILLESLELEAAGGLDGLLRELRQGGYNVDDVLAEPYWLQDDVDGKCFGPGGFSECGDATLWLVRKRPNRRTKSSDNGKDKNMDEAEFEAKKRGRRGGFFSSLLSLGRGENDGSDDDDEEQWGYALELIDGNLLASASASASAASASEEAKPRKTGRRWARGGHRNSNNGDDERECLISRSDNSGGTASGEAHQGNEQRNLRLGPCSSEEAWTWRINGDGVLVQDERALERARRTSLDGAAVGGGGPLGRLIQRSIPQLQESAGSRPSRDRGEQPSTNCIWRLNNTAAAAGPCDVTTHEPTKDADAGAAATAPIEVRVPRDRTDARSSGQGNGSTPQEEKERDHDEHDHTASDKRLVGFSLIRYQATATGTPTLPSLARAKAKVDGDGASPSVQVSDDAKDCTSPRASSGTYKGEETLRDSHQVSDAAADADASSPQQQECTVPTTTRTSQSHASGPAMHPELKPVSQLLFTSVSPTGSTRPRKKKEEEEETKSVSSASSLLTANLVGASPLTLGAASASRGGSSRRAPIGQKKKPGAGAGAGAAKGGHPDHRHLLHHPPTPSMGGGGIDLEDDAPHKPRKIPVHSYIESATDGMWADPDTGLEYLTDLSEYLGHDRKETGRHTLMGVGQYTRTVFKIKVYGCALYVAKRDALADAGFVPFATQTSEELRGNDNFYDHLMTNDPAESNSFDRTLFIKTNMQLATEVMRNSLEADWKLLTPEHKHMLISSSLNPRDAEGGMLSKIQSKDNPSKCSCGQNAPEEYGADPSCCARGTELAFTWRKNGYLELRLDGRVMDTFPDTEIGKGIFYEYLRGDDPMSMEARDRFADGFPFLLAPLAQVKGVSSPVLPHEGAAETPKKTGKKGLGVLRLFGTVADAFNSQAESAQEWAQASADEMKSNVANAMRAAESSARNLHADLERRRALAWDHLISLPGEASQMLSRMPFVKERGSHATRVAHVDYVDDEERKNRTLRQAAVAPRGRAIHSQTGRAPEETDEIGVIIYPTMNFTHRLFLYTVHFYLMLLLIVSVPGSYSTRLVIKRPGGSRSKSVSTYDDSDDEAYCSMMGMESDNQSPSGIRGLEVSLQVRLEDEKEVTEDQPVFWDEENDQSEEEASSSKRKAASNRESTDSQQQTSRMTKSLSYYL